MLATGKTTILIDQGFGPVSLRRRLKLAGLEGTRLDAVLLTHGHSDHSSGVAAIVKEFPVPVYMNEGTRSEAVPLSQLDRWERFDSGRPFTIGDIDVEAFPISHDAAEPVGFRFEAEGLLGAFATDLGELNPPVLARLKGCDWLVLESNHDEEMLKLGPYPWLLKQRVLGRTGHLSNTAIARFLSGPYDGSARHLFLAHLSRENNDPEIALRSARNALGRRRLPLFDTCSLHLTHQNKPSIVLNL